MEFHHIGIATENIDEMILKLKKFFKIKDISDKVYDENQDANLCMVTLEDGVKIELISGNVVSNILKKRQYLYHTCYTVKDLNKMIESLTNDGALLIKEAKEAVLFNNKRVAFLMWDMGLIELLEEC